MAKIYLPNTQRTDGPMYDYLQTINSEVPILLLARDEEFEFNNEILELEGNDYVVVDVIEQGWAATIEQTLILGGDLAPFPDFNEKRGWRELNSFIAQNKPKKYLKRELLEKDVTDTIRSIEYPNFNPIHAAQTKDEFDSRPIRAFWYWGRSHEARLMLAGQIWKNAAKKGYTVCDNIYQFSEFMKRDENPEKWVTFHMPYYQRAPMSDILHVNGMSKLSVSLFGAGRKCFRNTGESIVNSICVLPEDGLAYSYKFEHGKNCIKFSIENDVTGLKNEWKVCEAIEEALKRNDLYKIYLESLKAAEWYQAENYKKNYIEPIINNA